MPSENWSCAKCGEINAPLSGYCRKCGDTHAIDGVTMTPSPKSGSGVIVVVIAVVLISLLVAGGVAGYYFWDKAKTKEAAQIYVKAEGEAFGRIVGQLNGLSTDKDVSNDEKGGVSIDVLVGKIQDEEVKSAKVLAEIKASKEANGAQKANDLVSGTDGLLKKFLPTLEEHVGTYHAYLVYKIGDGKAYKKFSEEIEKTETVFNNAKTDEDLIKAIDARTATVRVFIDDLKLLTPPAGLEELQKKEIERDERLIVLMNELKKAVQNKSEDQLNSAITNIDDFTAGATKYSDDANQMAEYYFDRMHSRFMELQKDADTIKTELSRLSFELPAQMTAVSIEGW